MKQLKMQSETAQNAGFEIIKKNQLLRYIWVWLKALTSETMLKYISITVIFLPYFESYTANKNKEYSKHSFRLNYVKTWNNKISKKLNNRLVLITEKTLKSFWIKQW